MPVTPTGRLLQETFFLIFRLFIVICFCDNIVLSSNRSLSSCCLPLMGLISSVLSDLGSKIFSSLLCMKSYLFPNHLRLHLFQYDFIIHQDRWPRLQGVGHEKSYHSQGYSGYIAINPSVMQEYLPCNTKSFYLPSCFISSYSLTQIWTWFETISLICRHFNCLLLIVTYFLDNLYIVLSF